MTSTRCSRRPHSMRSTSVFLPLPIPGRSEAATRAKKHLFVEKPLGLDSKKAVAMAELAKKNRVITQIGYHMRFGTAVRKLKADDRGWIRRQADSL